jgi:hypothetical protein
MVPTTWFLIARYPNAVVKRMQFTTYYPSSERALRRHAREILAYRLCMELGL